MVSVTPGVRSGLEPGRTEGSEWREGQVFADVSNLFVREDVAATPRVPQSHSALAKTCMVRA